MNKYEPPMEPYAPDKIDSFWTVVMLVVAVPWSAAWWVKEHIAPRKSE